MQHAEAAILLIKSDAHLVRTVEMLDKFVAPEWTEQDRKIAKEMMYAALAVAYCAGLSDGRATMQ